jgi:ATP/maltotriose-dependent transcriptional regulator MalT
MTFGEVLSAQRLALVETGRGELDRALQRLVNAYEKAQGSDSPLVRIHSGTRILSAAVINRWEARDLPGATQFLAQSVALQQRFGDCPSCDVLLYPAAVPVYLALGDLERASWAADRAEQTAVAFGSNKWVATSHYVRGLLSNAQGNGEQAEQWLRRALEGFRRLGQPYEVAQTLESLAVVRTRERRAALAEALALYRKLGAHPAVARLEAAMSETGLV